MGDPDKEIAAKDLKLQTQKAPTGPELFIGIVGAVGSDMTTACEALVGSLREVNYTTSPIIRISELFHSVRELGLPTTVEEFARISCAYERYEQYMTAGNKLRKDTLRGEAAALLAIMAIRKARHEAHGDENSPLSRHAHIIRSLKHVEEIAALRRIYGSSFLLLGVYSRRNERVQTLARQIADSHHSLTSVDHRDRAESLVQRDEKESDFYGQNIRETFPKADIFVDVDDQQGLRDAISRFVRLLFGDYRHTPTMKEQGMFMAKAASFRSSSLSRQVGAAITSARGEVLAVGANEVPRAAGGTYWEGDDPDGRDIARKYDISDKFRRHLLGEVLGRLKDSGWLAAPFNVKDEATLLTLALDKVEDKEDYGPLKGVRVMDIIEFGRTVHAEMTALMDSARLGIPVAKATLHTTTFPCHECARHIVAAGIREVVYVEPYAKSLATELYPDSVAVESTPDSGQVPFVPFIGVAPTRYVHLFEMRGDRKAARGVVPAWEPLTALPCMSEDPIAYLDREQKEVMAFRKTMEEKGLTWI